MLLIKLTCFDEPEYLIFRQNRPLVRWFKVADSDPDYPDHIGLAYSKVFAQDRYQWELYYALA